MRKVWCMNLKDNREQKDLPNGVRMTKEKVEHCRNNGIVAIGWAVSNKKVWKDYRQEVEQYYATNKGELYGFKCAANALKKMRKGDLVWAVVHDSKINERWLLQVVGNGDPATDKQKPIIDVGAHIDCKFMAKYSKSQLPDCLKDLYSRHTIEMVGNARVVARKEIENLARKNP